MQQSLLPLFLLVVLTSAIRGEDTVATGWRGDGTGRFPKATPLTSWSLEDNVIWKTELPGGSPASPVLIGQRLFVVSDPALLLCVSATDGEELWRRSHAANAIGGEEGVKAGRDNPTHNPDGHAGSAASTPISDGRNVFTMFANGIASAHDFEGNRKWVRFIEKPETGFGHATSPALAGGILTVQFRNLYALDAETGKELWRLEIPILYTSPVITRVGKTYVRVHPSGSILRLQDGKVLADGLFRLTQSSPVVYDRVVYANENGVLKALELPANEAERIDVKSLWETQVPRGQYQIASPVVHDGCVYTVSLNGIIQATICSNGEQLFRSRLLLSSRVYASLHFSGGKLFVADQTGKTIVLRATREYQEDATDNLDYHPTSFVFSGSKFYVRTYRHVLCVGE